VQREIEAAGISTITLSSIPDLTAAVSVPRLAAIEHPLGYLLGQPGDPEGQRAVLRATLRALAEMTEPGSLTQLPFEWPASARRLSARPSQAPPSAGIYAGTRGTSPTFSLGMCLARSRPAHPSVGSEMMANRTKVFWNTRLLMR
jgi:D-proline reductase (dithiol) PrdB